VKQNKLIKVHGVSNSKMVNTALEVYLVSTYIHTYIVTVCNSVAVTW